MADNTGEAGPMVRFADPSLFTTVPLPGGGEAVMRSEIGGGEARSASTRGGWIDRNRWLATPEKDRDPDMPDFNGSRSDAEFIARFTKSWTLTKRDGSPAPITADMALLLDEPTWLALMDHIQGALDDDALGCTPKRIKRSIAGYLVGDRIAEPASEAEALTYDVVLVARRGFGVEEERLATPAFADAVRWAQFAERLAPELIAARQKAATDPPEGLMKAGGSASWRSARNASAPAAS
jgi:hypothetical protein